MAINRDDNLNRGLELLLRKKSTGKKTFSSNIEKEFQLFKRKFTIQLNFSFDVKKQKGDPQ